MAHVGLEHSICLSDDGSVFGFGGNQYGQLGVGHCDDVLLPTQIPSLTSIKMISCGQYFTVCLNHEGIMWSFGQNNYGQLGVGNKQNQTQAQQIKGIPPVELISCGY